MRILILSQWFTPEPILKGLVFAKALAERGHQVEVLTGFPNYPGGVVYRGYRLRLFQRENMEGIAVIRTILYPSHNTNQIGRISNYISFALSAPLAGLFLAKKADVMYVYHPPATIAFAAIMIKFFRRIPFVYDIQDLWPDTLAATGMIRNRMALGAVDYWCRVAYHRASKIVVLSPGFKQVLIGRGVAPEKIEVIYNWCEEDKIIRTERNEDLARNLGMSGRFNVVFAGTMGKAQDLDTVLAAAAILKTLVPRAQIVLIGGGIEVERLKMVAADKGLTNVLFLPRRPVNEIGEILNLADVLLVHLRKDPLFRITIPSKVQAYLAVGKPILVGVEGDATSLVLRAGAGLAYDPGHPENLAEAVREMAGMSLSALDQMGERGRQFYKNELSITKGVNKFERVFSEVAKDNGLNSRKPAMRD
jgi:glycosyltransferase involved in cell wall biosynthesis